MKILNCIGRFGSITNTGTRPARRPHHAPRARYGAIAGLASLLLVGIIVPALATEPEGGAERVASAVNERLGKLGLKPRSEESIPEKAQHARNAIKASDFSTAQQITGAILSASHLENWRYYPFQDFIAAVPDVNDSSFEAKLNAWVEQDKSDVIPLIIRAQFHYDMGWFKRGHDFARDTPVNQMDEFGKYMVKALADTEAAIKLDESNPYTLYLKLRILRGFGLTEGLDRAFQDAITKHPKYYPLYDLILGTLEPRWGGTPEAMRTFVDRYAGPTAEDSPLKLLYLSLYRYLLSSASTSCNGFQRSAHADCVRLYMGVNASPELEQQVEASLQLYQKLDKHQFNIALQGILIDMLKTPGGEMYSGAVLELAASATHSDTRLKEENPGKNDYMIGLLAGESWYQKGFHDNAQIKYKEA